MNIFHHRYLSKDQLERCNTYKYAAIDTSPISQYVMHPFWNAVVKLIPMSIAPNVLTLAGFTFTLISALLLSYYDYYFRASSDDLRQWYNPVPNFIWFVCAINLFLAHTLDGIDGKQARRTKATGPLGELMDHGVDSWTAVFIPMYVYSFFGSADHSFGPHRMLLVIWSVFFTFYITHWEKYITNVLYLPWSYDFSQIFLFICSLATHFGGYRIWKVPVPYIGLDYSQVFELILYGSIFMTLPMPLYNVYHSCKSEGTRYTLLSDVLRPLVPLTLLFSMSLVWAFHSKNDIISQDPRVYYFTIGTIFSNISCRLIICQMSKTPCELFNRLSSIFSLVALFSMYTPIVGQTELLILRLLAITITLAHLHYAVCVVRQLCDHFNINCLSLGKRKPLLSEVKLTDKKKH